MSGWMNCQDCHHPASCHRGNVNAWKCKHCDCVMDEQGNERVATISGAAGRALHDQLHPGEWDMFAHEPLDDIARRGFFREMGERAAARQPVPDGDLRGRAKAEMERLAAEHPEWDNFVELAGRIVRTPHPSQ